jgi:integrase/recombinase XerC
MTWVKTTSWPAGTRGAGAARRSTWWPRCAACTGAVEDGLIAEADDPARKVAKPRRLPSTPPGRA